MSAELVIANAIVSSLVALKLDSKILYQEEPEARRRLQEVFHLSISFMNLLQSKAEKQSIDIFSEYEKDSQTWAERLPELIQEKGLDQDQEILAAAREILPYGNDLIKIARKLFAGDQFSVRRDLFQGNAGLPGDPTTDAPPPKK